MKQRNVSFSRLCIWIGSALILLSAVALLLWQIFLRGNDARVRDRVEALRSLIPEPQPAMLEERVDNAMPSLTVEGADYIAILELPAMGAAFPVGASRDSVQSYPYRYDGSVYDGSLIIGTSNGDGQFSFVKELVVGDFFYLTDMTGNRFAYRLSDIRYAKHADNQTLSSEEADLTVFVKNLYAFEYVILHCIATGT